MRLLVASALSAAVLGLAAPASAAVIATLTFDTPTGTVLSNQAIPVWMTLHLSADSDPVTTDATGAVTSGLTEQDIIGLGLDPAAVVRTNVNNAFECSGTFTNGCGPGAYAFDFNYDAPSLIGAINLDLEPGSDMSFLFGTFNPVGGNAPAGLYTFYNVIFIATITTPNPDYDPNDPGSSPYRYTDFDFAASCRHQDPSCAFTRQVEAAPGAVPEPAAWALMIAGFGGAGAMLRRRRAAGLAA